MASSSLQQPQTPVQGSSVELPEEDYGQEPTNFSVKDPIHNYIELGPIARKFIDTPHFQRLRHIKQLGTSYYVWCGASHNRLEHCLGVAHLARALVLSLQKQVKPSLNITDRDVMCVELAGLCHDLGHGPFSHVFDGLFLPNSSLKREWTHEQGSVLMLHDMIKTINDAAKRNAKDSSTLPPPILPEKDIKFIKALILGDKKKCPDEKPFLFEIVANKRNGLDVDKFDYILRDSYATGQKRDIDVARLLSAARVIDNEICFPHKDYRTVFDVCKTRFELHSSTYNHKTAKAIEYMLTDALLEADKHMNIAGRVLEAESFMHLTDYIIEEIKQSRDPKLAKAKELLKRVDMRDLYKQVHYRMVEWDDKDLFEREVTPETIVAAAQSLPIFQEYPECHDLAPDHVIVSHSLLHYGMKEKNPLDNVKWYSKDAINVSRKATAQEGARSTVMPRKFAEVSLQIFTRDVKYYQVIQKGYEELFRRNLNADQNDDTHKGGSIPHAVMTPPTTEAPSSPPPTAAEEVPTDVEDDVARPPKSSATKTRKPMSKTYSSHLFAPTSPTLPARTASRKRSRETGDTPQSPALGASGANLFTAPESPTPKRRRT